MTTRRQTLQAALGAGALLASGQLLAQGIGPSGSPARLVVPYPPGGATDVLARIVAQRLAERWGQPVLVEYQPGAGTMIGVSFVARAPADGLTFGIVNSAFPINSITRKTPYDSFRDLVPITQMVDVPLALVANVSVPFDNVPQLVAYAKKNPGRLSFGTPGTGGSTHLAGELLNRVAGIDLLHVPYKGGAAATTDVIGGQIQMQIEPLLSVLPHIKAGRLKMIAILSPRRLRGLDAYPAVAETYPGFDATTFLGLVAPAGVAQPVIQKIAADVLAVLKDPRDAQRIAELGMYPNAQGPDAFNRLLHSEVVRWSRLIREGNLKLD